MVMGIALARAGFVLMCLALGCTSAGAAEPLDIKSVPRIAGDTEMWTNGDVLLYMSPLDPDQTGKTLRQQLTVDGWTLYDAPPYEKQTEDTFVTQDFKKGPYAISVYVTAAPAKNNRTSVQYGVYPVAEPLPNPKDATELGFSYNKAHLECLSAQSPEQLLEFYRTELAASGWQRWTAPSPPGGKSASGSVRTHFVKENKQPLLLILSPNEQGRTIVYLKGVPHEEMMAEYAPKSKPAQKVETAPPAAAEPKDDDEGDSDAKFEDLVQGLIKEAMKPVAKAKPAKDDAADQVVTPIGVLAESTAPIPLPENAEEIDHDGDDGTLEFESKSNVKSLAEFYRTQMKFLGWTEKRGLDSTRLLSLDFRKIKDSRLQFTIHNMGDRVDVSARGDVLKVAEQAPAPGPSEVRANGDENTSIELPSEAPKETTLNELQAGDKNGLPVPQPNSSSGTLKSKFLYAALASLPASIETVIAFYRNELPKRGWTEDTPAASLKSDAATLKFTTKEGPANLKLTRSAGQTNIELTVRQTALAEASGLMPKAGNVKIMFGNIEDAAGEITINKKTFKVKGGERAEDPKGPSIELPPGKYSFEVKLKGKPSQKDEAEFGANEIWGVLIGPGGGLPLQMY